MWPFTPQKGPWAIALTHYHSTDWLAAVDWNILHTVRPFGTDWPLIGVRHHCHLVSQERLTWLRYCWLVFHTKRCCSYWHYSLYIHSYTYWWSLRELQPLRHRFSPFENRCHSDGRHKGLSTAPVYTPRTVYRPHEYIVHPAPATGIADTSNLIPLPTSSRTPTE